MFDCVPNTQYSSVACEGKINKLSHVKCKCPFFVNIQQTLHYKVIIE